MSVRSVARAVLVASSLALAAPMARSDPESPNAPPIHVVAIRSDDAYEQAEALTVAIRSRVRALHGWSLGEGDHALEILTLSMKCGEVPDEDCQAKIGQQIQADRYIWGRLKRLKYGQVSADLHLWSRGRPATTTQITYSDNLTAPGDDALKRIVDGALAKLVGVSQKGTLVVRSQTAASGDLYVDGQSSGVMSGGEAQLVLAPGTHKVELRNGEMIQTGTVNVRPDVSIELILAPVDATAKATGTEASSGAASGLDAQASNRSSRVMGWAALGMGLALTGGGIYSVVRIRQIESDEGYDRYRQGFRTEQNVCDEARAGVRSSVPGAASPDEVSHLCSEASSFKTLQYIFFGLGAVSTGAGIYLLLRQPRARVAATVPGPANEQRPRWQLTPHVGRSAAGLQLRLTF